MNIFLSEYRGQSNPSGRWNTEGSSNNYLLAEVSNLKNSKFFF